MKDIGSGDGLAQKNTITRRDRMRNEVIREVVHQEETLVNKIKKKRLAFWFGHVNAERPNSAW